MSAVSSPSSTSLSSLCNMPVEIERLPGIVPPKSYLTPPVDGYEQGFRKKHWKNVSQDIEPEILIILGQSSSGKSHLVNLAGEIGGADLARLITRPARPGDGRYEKPWIDLIKMEIAHADPGDQGFAMYNYNTYYGNPGSELKRLTDGSKPVTILGGKMEDLPSLVEFCKSVVPGCRVLALRLAVSPDLLGRRLKNRALVGGSNPKLEKEVAGRLEKLSVKYQADMALVEPWAQYHQLAQVINITAEEANKLGVMNAPSQLDEEEFSRILRSLRLRAREKQLVLAKDILEPKEIDLRWQTVTPELLKATEEVASAAAKLQLPMLIKGGLAAAYYLGSNARPTSDDIDFQVPWNSTYVARLAELAVGFERAKSDLKLAPNEMLVRWVSNSYHIISRKGMMTVPKSESVGDSVKVELDMIAKTIIEPDNKGFCFEFNVDHFTYMMSREMPLPNGEVVNIVPPEMVLVEKLIAGRLVGNSGETKFDLFDAGGILATIEPGALSTPLIHKIVFEQTYSPEIDVTVRTAIMKIKEEKTLIADEANAVISIADFFKEVGVSLNPRLLDMYANKKVDLNKIFNLPTDNEEEHNLSLTAVKHLAMMSRMLDSLEKIVNTVDHKYLLKNRVGPREFFDGSLNEHFNADKVIEPSRSLANLLLTYSRHLIGRGDIFVRREHTSQEQLDTFFKILNEMAEKPGD